jgi:DNA ligase 1
MKNREFLMLAHNFDKAKHRLAGNYVSEKMDGMRAIWIPQTCGRPVNEVFFANVAKKRGKQAVAISSGLWTRYGNIIHAPASFTDQLPKDVILDGELHFGRGGWQRTMETVKHHVPGPGWAEVKYSVFDAPYPTQMFEDGRINNPNFKKSIYWDQAKIELGFADKVGDNISRIFEFTYKKLMRLGLAGNIEVLPQELLPFNKELAEKRFEEIKNEILQNGGEGVIIRYSSSEWEPCRSSYVYKYKEQLDSEGVVVGFTAGELGKHHGKIGSLRILWDNVLFDLSGFTDEERAIDPQYEGLLLDNPGNTFLDADISAVFLRGVTVQFKYREVTPDGKPKEARFHRVVA